jgi:hypothetical protein
MSSRVLYFGARVYVYSRAYYIAVFGWGGGGLLKVLYFGDPRSPLVQSLPIKRARVTRKINSIN